MKVIKAKIYVTKVPGGTSYEGGYPPEWDSTRIPFILYPLLTGTIDEGNDGRDFQWVIATVPDDLYNLMLKNTDRFQTVTLDDAQAMEQRHRPQTNKITDLSIMANILPKLVTKEPFTIQELKALDPNDPTPGINKSRSCKDHWDEYGVTW